MRLITQRSQVQILPPLQVKSQVSNLEPFGLAVAREDSAGNLRVRGPFDLRIGGAFCIAVCSWYPRPSGGRTWIATGGEGFGSLEQVVEAGATVRLTGVGPANWIDRSRRPGPCRAAKSKSA